MAMIAAVVETTEVAAAGETNDVAAADDTDDVTAAGAAMERAPEADASDGRTKKLLQPRLSRSS